MQQYLPQNELTMAMANYDLTTGISGDQKNVCQLSPSVATHTELSLLLRLSRLYIWINRNINTHLFFLSADNITVQ